MRAARVTRNLKAERALKSQAEKTIAQFQKLESTKHSEAFSTESYQVDPIYAEQPLDVRQ